MNTLRPISIADYTKVATPSTLGKPPKLEWLSIKSLVVDPEYQREIGDRGKRNINRIAQDFDWSKFSTVIVAPAGSNQFAIVDGQHRVTAAALCGLDRVPCQIIDVDRRAQAAAYAAVNTVVTAMSALQIHAAKVASGDERAIRLNEVCKAGGVTICRYPVPANKMKAGDTVVVSKLYHLLEKYGADVLSLSMRCVTRTRKGYPGFLRPALVEAFCVNLEAEPAWAGDEYRLLKVINRIDLAAAFKAAAAKAAGLHAGTTSELVDIIGAHIEENFGKVAA